MKHDGKVLAEVVADTINVLGDHTVIAEFVESMARQHRTLQQGVTRLCIAWLRHLAGLDDGQYDLRNEASVKLAKKMMAAAGDKSDCHLPLI